VDLYDTKKTHYIQCHDSSMGIFALNFDGKLLATTSEKGTLIRIWDTTTGKKLQELRRGADQAEIQSLCFSPKTSKWLAVSSHKGTVHIFKIKKPLVEKASNENNQSNGTNESNGTNDSNGTNETKEVMEQKDDEKEPQNPTSNLNMFKGVLPKYFSSEWSFAQLRTPDVRTVVAFGTDETSIIVVSADGMFYKATFDGEKGGECKIQKKAEFLEVHSSSES